MAKYSSSIHYKISTSLDAAGITKLQAELNKLEHEFSVLHSQDFITNSQKTKALNDIKRIQTALTSAFNPRLGMLNTKQLTAELTKSGNSLQQTFKNLGPQGTAAMAQLYGQLGKVDTGMKSVSKTTDKIFNTLGNTVRWGVIASGFQYVLNGAHSAVQYMADLDKSLTNIRLVTDESKESMRQFAQYANDAAKSLGSTTVAYTDAALIYAQQGYGLKDQKALADYTIKAANATGQDTAEVSEQMTSLINGFQLSVDEVGGALDVLAKIANVSAADMEELAVATSKVASTANTLGVTQEQLTAQIGTIVSITREAPENVGNALKTIYARFGDLKLGETLDDGTDLGKVSSTLEKIGVQVLDSSGAMRDMGLIMEDLMEVWDTLDTATKQGAAVTLAGKYQYNRLMALMENSDMYDQLYQDAKNSSGTLDTMQDEYMESLEGKTNALVASLQGALTSLFNQDTLGPMIDDLTEVVNLFTELTDVIGGGGTALTAFGAIATNVFSNNIGRSIANVIGNREKSQMMKSNIDAVQANARAGLYSKGASESSERMQTLAKQMEAAGGRAGIMNQEQFDAYNQGLEKHVQLIEQADNAEKEYKQAIEGTRIAFAALGIAVPESEEELVGFIQELENADASLEDASSGLLKFSDNLSNAQSAATKLANALNEDSSDADTYWSKVQQEAQEYTNEIQGIIQVFDKLGNKDEEIKELEQVLEMLGKAATGDTQDVEKLEQALERVIALTDRARTATNDAIKNTPGSVEDLSSKRNSVNESNIALDAHEAAQQGMIDNLAVQEAASGIADLAGGLLSLVSAWQMVSNLDDIWNNEDLELGEKMGQIFTNLLMSTSMLAMGVMELSNGFKSLGASGVIQKAATGMMGLTGAETAATAANMGLRTALATLLPPVLAIVAVLGALAIGVKALTDAYNKDAIAAEKAVEDAKAAKQVYQDLNTEVTNLKNNISNYQEARDALSDLKEGTEEWKKAVQDTNTEVLNLLDTYPELAQYVTRSNEGVLSISQAGLDALVEAKEEAAKDARNASLIADLGANQAKTKAQETSVRRQVDWWQSDPSGLTGGTMMNLSESQMSVLEQGYKSGVSIGDAEAIAELFGVDVTNPMVTAITENADRLIGFWEDKSNQEAADSQKQQELMQGLLNEQQGYNQETQENNGQLLAELARMSDPDSALYQEKLTAQKAKSTEDLAYDYAEQIGMNVSNIEVDRNGLGKDDDTVTITDMDGNIKQFSRTMMESSIAGAEAMEAAAEKWNAVADKLLGFDSSSEFAKVVGNDAYDTLANWKQGDALDTSALSTKDLNRLHSMTTAEGGLTKEQLLGDMSDEDAAAMAKQAGYVNDKGEGDVDAYVGGISDTINQAWEKENTNTSEDFIANNKRVERNWSNMESDESFDARQNAQADAFLATAKDTADLRLGYDEGYLDVEDYTRGLTKMADEMGGLQEEIDNTEKALSDYNTAVKDNGENSEEAKKAAMELASSQDELRDAIDSKEWAKAREQLEGYADDLANAEEGSEEYTRATEKIAGVLTDLTGQDVTAEWVAANKDAVLDYINGVEGAGAKLNALANIDAARNNWSTALSSMGLDYQTFRDLVNNNQIQFDMTGHADFSQVNAALGGLTQTADISEEELQQLAALLQAFGGASLTLENNGNIMRIRSLPAEATPEEMNVWMTNVRKALADGWHFEGVDLPESNYDYPTGSPSGNPSGPGGSGGGGGGGGGKSYEPKTEKHLEEEPDRYQDVNAHLDRLSNNLDKIADEQDRLAGKALLDNMQKQVDLIQEQTNWHQKKLEIQQQEAAELRKELGADYGLTFDANGYIENYETTHQQLIDEYNALVDQYNNTSDEEGQEKLKEKMDAVKEKIDKFNEGWERYDELMNNEIPDSIKTLEDLEDQIEDLRIEAFNAAVEAADNIKEVQDAWADYMGFMSGLHPDSPFRALTEDAMKYENALDSVTAKQEDLEQLMQWLPQYQPGGVITSDNPFGENSAEFYEALQTAYQSYIEAALEAEQLYYDQIDDVIESYDDIADRIEKRMENYARLTEQLDHYASVIETLYGEEDYDNLLAIKRANQDVLESSIEQQRANLSMWQNELAKYNKETQPEIWEAIHEQVVEAEGELNGLVEEAAENTAAILEMAVDKTVKEWKDTMLGGDADWMETQWELIKQNADQYLDTVEETYELEKLRSKYNSLANDTADLNLRKRINDQMEKELAYLKEKDKLSEYDVNYANAKLEILQKQIALEEAQANKNQMKLRRDSQGNYSYVYTANQDDVENARNDLLDSEFNAYSMSKENYLTNYDNYIAAISAAAEQIKAINADTMLSEEEKAERTQWIYDNLKQYLSGIAEQIGVSEQGMLESVKYLAMDSSEIVGQNYADIAAMMEENWTEALGVIGVAVSEEFDHIIHNMDEFLDKTQEKWTEFEDHTQEWADNVNDIADEGTDGFRDIDDVIIDINNDMKELNEETEDFFALINDDLGTIDKAVGKLADYEKQLLGLKESTSKVRAELEEARAEILEKENEIRNLRNELKAAQDKNNGSGGDSGSGGGGSDENKAASIATEALEIVKGVHYGTIANGIGGWRPSAREAGYSEDAISVALTAFNNSKTGSGYSYYYDRALELVKSYDTGGYTGVWGKEGRLAMLHQKELVLNASDTSNILAAVSAIREIVSVMKADSISSMLSIGRNSNIATNTGNNIQQNVEIYADFPAAESAAEIKAALEGLAQQAIQYSMRTR